MSALKVLTVLHDSRRSGVPAVAFNLMTALDRSQVVPSALFAYHGVYAAELQQKGVDVRAVGTRRPFIWRLNRFLLNVPLLRLAQEVDVVHIHSTKLALSAILAKLSGGRVVFHLHELPRRVGLLVKIAMRLADCTVFCSRACADHFADVPARRKRTIVNALIFSDRPPVQHTGSGGKVVMVGSINSRKGQDLLLKAFARLEDRNAKLWLYGTTGLSARKYVHDLKRASDELGLADRVFFPGPTTDVCKVFAEASVVVHTSWTESFGMALVEAQSCGVPVIAHDLEGMREVVVDGITGYLIPPGDVAVLTERMDQLLADPALRNRLGGAGYAMVRERFGMAERVAEYVSLYRELCRA